MSNNIKKITSSQDNTWVKVDGDIPLKGIFTCYFSLKSDKNVHLGIVDTSGKFWYFWTKDGHFNLNSDYSN